MTDLQVGLLILGAVAVFGVVIYNRIQECSVRREAQRAFGSAHADVLLDAGHARREPILVSDPVLVSDLVKRPAQSEALPDERLDYIVTLRIPMGIPAASVLESWRPIEQRFARRVLLAGSGGTGWRPVAQADFGSFSSLRAALQLVSRAGVVSEAELLEFRSGVESLAARIRAEVSSPEMRGALEAARALDKLCAETDIQVAFHVIGEGLDQAAVEAAVREIGEAPYEVARRADGLTLILDIPRSSDIVRGYEAMTRTAKSLAARLGGSVVDDRGNPLDDRALAAIEAQMEPMRRQLAEGGIQPGSPLALRLFS
jgi:ZipA, C-terminal FtsZ-binding domain